MTKQVTIPKKKLTAENLKVSLWETLVLVKRRKIDPSVANSVSAQAREIMRVVHADLTATRMNGEKPTKLIESFFRA